jgi:glycosyltransferase involved in cell wall biosynthesis
MSPTGKERDADTPSITALILCYNEELHLERCLVRIRSLARRIVVVDSFSTDRSVEIARAHGAEVLQHPWKNYADQFQWGIDHAKVNTDWVLRLDCDEYFEDAAIQEIVRSLPNLSAQITGISFKRKFIFWERWIRHGRHYPTVLLRLWRHGAGAIEQRWMDEHIVLSHGREVLFEKGDLVDHNLNDIGWWTDKHNGYATRHMIDFLNLKYRLYEEDERLLVMRGANRRKLKTNWYARAPRLWRCLAFYVYRYIFRLGFLDGREGLVFHFLHGLWLFVLIDVKIEEAEKMIRTKGIEEFLAFLRLRHKIDLACNSEPVGEAER